MSQWLRDALVTALGLLLGVIVMFAVIMGIETISHRIYPAPPGLDPMNPAHEAAFVKFVTEMPLAAKTLVGLAWVLGAFAGGFIAARFARHPRVAAVLVALVVMSGVAGMIMKLPHPTWLAMVGLVLPIPAALLAAKLAKRRTQRQTGRIVQ